ncbi:MAG: hypothetical protein IJE89_05905 [Bacilli bacterium]|nr:hypothetical protein [Bacilli bacterium]
MKKVKILFWVILVLITCTGCSVEYNINITKNNIEEVINVTDYITSNRTKSDILNHYNMWYPTFVNFIEEGESIEIEDFTEKVDGIKYHDKTIKEFSNGYNYTYKYTYSKDEYYDSYVLASIFPETTVHEEIDKLVIRTSKENFLCSYEYFDSAKINITIDPEIYELNYTNTSSINNNTYTWILNRNNCSDGEIILTLNKIIDNDNDILNPNKKNENNEESIISKYALHIFCGILILIILVVYILFKKIKNKNTNSIDD